jgi:acyl transferase domain-containing protein/acyl carrier protein
LIYAIHGKRKMTSQKPNEDSRLRSRLQETPIAVIGIACLFPQARNLREFWDNILNKRDSITDVPSNRWDVNDYYDPDPRATDKTYSKRGGFLPEIDFDPMEFGIPPNILELTDSSQLLSLVVAKAVLEDAGYGECSDFDRDRIGVVLGTSGTMKLVTPLTARLQYPIWKRVLRKIGLSEKDTEAVVEKIKKAHVGWEENSFPGMLQNVVAGRVANRLNLGGTNCVVDAACASSMGALKLAISDLLEYRSDIMISGGVDTDNSILSYMCFSKTPAFAEDDRCRPFDVDSKGMMVGEGIGMVALKRLEDAERDKDRIYAVIRGIGTSSDGRFSSIYNPRPEGQVKALKRAYEDAGIQPSTVGLVEAHGTGTKAGDPAEVQALKTVFGEDDPKKQHIALGTVKSQIGHTKAAAGAASLIKASLALHHKILPPTINVKEPNPKFELDESPFYVNTETRPWIRTEDNSPRRAAVSAFGFGGTNFHVVLEEYAKRANGPYRLHGVPHSLLLSAPTPEALREECERVLRELESENGGTSHQELVASCKASEIPREAARIGFVSESLEETRERLKLALETLESRGEEESWRLPKGVYYRKRALDLTGKVVALFSGQGSQYVEMGKEVACNFPNLLDAYRGMDRLFAEEGRPPLSGAVFPRPAFDPDQKKKNEEQLRNTEFAQPAIGVLSSGLFKILAEAGFKPDFVAGHSFGELTALWAAQVLTDEDFFALARARGRAMAAPEEPGFDAGRMLAVIGDVEAIRKEVEGESAVTVANLNSKQEVVLAGPTERLVALQKQLKGKGYRVVPLPVSAAFHTSLVGHAQKPFAKAIRAVKFRSPKRRVYSNTTGHPYGQEPKAIQKTLAEHILNPVLFRDEIENIHREGGRLFVEFGPRGVLTKLVGNILEGKPHVAVALNADPKRDSDRQLRQAVVELRVAGLPLRDIDPYLSVEPIEAGKRGGQAAIKLAGSNYVSERTQRAFLDALNDGHQISISGNATLVTPPPRGAEGDVPSRPVVPGTERVGKQGKPTPTPASNQTPAAEAERTLESLEKGLALFFKHQGETLKVHEQYLNHHMEYTRTFYDLMREQTSLLGRGLSGNVVEGLEQSMAGFHDHQGETLRVHEQYLRSQAEVSKYAIEALRGQSSLATGWPPAPISRSAPAVAVPWSEPVVPKPEPTETPPPPEPEPVAVPAATGPGIEALTESMLQVVSEKTGYPVEMLELDMEMEADLGIDSIKRVEILGTMMDLYPDLPEMNPEELAELKTLGQIVGHMESCLSGVPGAGTQESSHKGEEISQTTTIEGSVPRGIARLERLPPPDALEFSLPEGHVCLVTDDGTSRTVGLAEALVEKGWKVVVLSLPPSTVPEGPASAWGIPRVELRNLDEKHLKEKLQEIAEKDGPIGGLIHLNPCAGSEGEDGIVFSEKAKDILLHVFLLAKHLKPSLTQTTPPGRRFFLTVAGLDGCLGVGGGTFNTVDGGLFGLVKTLNLEWGSVFCRAVDLSPDLDEARSISSILQELHDPDIRIVETGYGVQGRVTLVADPCEVDARVEPDGVVDSSSVFVVSGGAKGVTASCVTRLAREYKCKFVLLGRSPYTGDEPEWARGCYDASELKKRGMEAVKAQGEKPTPRKVEEVLKPVLANREISGTLTAIRDAGGEAEYVQADVTDVEALRRISPVVDRLGDLTGLIHGAGVLADRLIEKKTISDFQSVYSTKVKGLEALLRSVDCNRLKYLILFSSAAGFFGNPGQSDYSIANEILNKAAYQFKKRHPDCHVRSFNWGPWDGGMVSDSLKKLFEERDIQVIPIEGGTKVFVDGFSRNGDDSPQVLVGSSMRAEGGDLSPELRTYRIVRRLNLDDNPMIRDHSIGGRPVFPAAYAMAWMVDACEQFYPGHRPLRCWDYRTLKGVVLDETVGHEFLTEIEELRKTNEGEIEFRVKISTAQEDKALKALYHYAMRVLLVPSLPEAPVYSDYDLEESQGIEGTALYQDGTLFHGPAFQMVERVLNLSSSRLTAKCRLPEIDQDRQGQFPLKIFDTYVVDAMGHCMLTWVRKQSGAASLPSRFQMGEQFRSVPPGHSFYITLDVKESTKTRMVSDVIAHDEHGRIYTRKSGFEVTISKQMNKLFGKVGS